MYKEKILNLLRAPRSGFLSGEELARKTGISRTMVWKHIKSLERDGFVIEAVPSQSYRITFEPDILLQSDIKTGLKTNVIGREIHIYSEVSSTNTRAMQMAADNAQEGTVVIAEMQTGGKGRRGRKWISPKGNLYVSVILRPDVPLHKAPLSTLMGAVAVASAIRTICRLQAVIKWPNDILLSGKKVCGLLTEMSAEQDRIRHIVLGIGVDVNMDPEVLPADIRTTTTTLMTETGRKVSRTELLREVLRELDRWYEVLLQDPAEVLKEWEKLNMTIGKRISMSGADEILAGTAEGIDGEGRLLVKLDDGTLRAVAAGDVTIINKS
jgi:BirA family biotin operon repressor/biotin-[acetyl-CoA-carboxylase] ligase